MLQAQQARQQEDAQGFRQRAAARFVAVSRQAEQRRRELDLAEEELFAAQRVLFIPDCLHLLAYQNLF